MALLLCYIHVSDTLPGKTATVNSFSGVSDKIKMFEMSVKATGNHKAQLNPNAEYMREIAAMKEERKVSLMKSNFEKLDNTGNRTSSSSVTRHIATPVIATTIATPAAAVQDLFIARPATPAPSQAEVKPDPVTVQSKSKAGHKNAPSLLTQIKHKFSQFWSSIQRYFSSFTETARLHQQEMLMRDVNTFRDKQNNFDIFKEVSQAYHDNPLKALDIYNTEKKSIILNEAKEIINNFKENNIEPDIRKLCEQANKYAAISGASSRSFILIDKNELALNIDYLTETSQQRLEKIEAEIRTAFNGSTVLRRSSQSIGGRQRANSVRTSAQEMISSAYSKLFNDIHNDERKIYGTRHSFDRNEMRAALLEGQPALTGLRTSSAA